MKFMRTGMTQKAIQLMKVIMFTVFQLRRWLQVVILTLPFTVSAADTEVSGQTVHADQLSISSTAQIATAMSVSSATAMSVPSATVPQATTKSADQMEVEETSSKFSVDLEISQSRNLVDFQDGTRQDATETLLYPVYSTGIGSFAAKIVYAQNQKDSEDINNGFADTQLIYTYPAVDWSWKSPYVLFLSPGLVIVAPTSQVSKKQTQLNLSTILDFKTGIRPDEIRPTEHNWSFVLGLTAGRNFYAYEEDINGNTLNQYSSNQLLRLSYSHLDFSIILDFVNRSRLTFKNNIRQTFVATQEIGYAFTDNLSLALGHTNEASAMKANAQESNLNIIDEKTSTAYITMGVSY